MTDTTSYGSFFTIKEIAEILRLNVVTIYDFVKTGRLQAAKFGKTYRVSDENLKEFINQNRVTDLN